MGKIRLTFFLLLQTIFSFAQNTTVTGTVTDKSDGTGLPGVSILAKGSNTGTITDIDGNYELIFNPQQDTAITFSFVGYVSQSFSVNSLGSILNISLEPDNELLEQVVVIGYGTQKKSDLTGSVSSVRGEDINKIPSSSAAQALQGKVSGVQVSSVSGEPGIAPVIRIRGIGTLNNSSPIYVVDGVILDDISFLNSADIESIEVLKDASSTAIYGSRGANGVIIISTKKGKTGNGEYQTINISAEFSLQHLSKKIDLLSAREFAEVVNIINPGTFNNIDRVDSTDWQDLIFENFAPLQNYHVSIAGSSGKYNYYFGTGFFLQDGIIPESSYERLTIKLNNSYAITKNIKFGTDITVAPDKKENPAAVVAQVYRAWPTSVPYNDDGSFAEVFGSGNPLAAIEYTNSNTESVRGVGTFYGDITFLKDFVFRSSYGFDASFSKTKTFTPAFFISSSQSNALNDLSQSVSNFDKWLWENTISYNKEIGKHRMNVLAGYTAQRTSIEYITAGIQNLIGEDPSLWYLQTGDIQYLTATNKSQYNNEPEITALLSYLGRVNYTFNNRYLFTASVRRDGSSKFGANNRWGVFPSVAVGWNIINESFMASSDIFSNLKIRASWGIIGNEKIFYLRQFSLVSNNQNAVFGSGEDLLQGSTYGSTGNPDLKWESTTQTDIGLELGLFNDRLTGEFDFYNKITDGILVDLITPGHLGNGPFATQTFNAAKVLNRGFEFNVAWNHQIGKIKYRIGALGSPIHNEVLALGAAEGIGSFISSGSLGNGQLVTRTVVGQPIGSFYGYEVEGIFQNEAELTSSAIIPGQQVGDLKFADLNSDGIIDDLDRTFIGSYIPDFVYGFNANVSYADFSISLDFSGQYGNEIYNGKNAVRPDLYNFESNVIDHWDGEGSSNTEPRPTAGGTNYEPSDYFIQDGSFLRLRSATVGYSLSNKLLTNWRITKANIYLRGTNLITFSDYTGYTPEIAAETALASGIDLGVYPLTSIYSIGIDLTF